MNKNQILWLSEPIEQAYIDCTSRLIVNMARHFKSGKALSTFEWQAAKLAEMGALRRESIAIIAKETGKREELIRGTLEAALGMDLEEIDDLLIRAAEAGVIRMPSETYLTSGRIQDLLEAMTQNTVEATNLVNTTMLQSTLSSYRHALGQAAVEEMRLGEQLVAAQSELNTATLSVASGAESRTQALRYAIRKMAEEGLTGFIDRAGRHWAPEGYVNMDIRTTVHNIAIQGQRIRSEEAGVSTFQISSHAGARPLCEPYQGKFYSWDGTSGILHDLNGGEHPYEGIGMTSYGEPAGIFGINCGHSPITFIDGFSIPRYSETEDKEENDRIYKESQQQRALEREIRKTRTEAAALNAAGDEEGFAQAARKANNQLIRYQDFCKEKDRTPRLDRLQVYGYNKSVAGKATQISKKKDIPFGTKALHQRNTSVRIPKYYKDNFDDCTPLNITDATKANLLSLRDLTLKEGYEYACVIDRRGAQEPYTSSLPDKIMINHDTLLSGTTLLHSHTNVTSFSFQDYHHLLDLNVDTIGLVTANGDAFVARVGDGYRPSEKEFSDTVKEIDLNLDTELQNNPHYHEWTPEERNYAYTREEGLRIVRAFEWILEGGSLNV